MNPKLFLIVAGLAALLGGRSALAEDPFITVATLTPSHGSFVVKVTFSQDVTENNCRSGECSILDPMRFNNIAVVHAGWDHDSQFLHRSILVLMPAIPLDANAHYVVIINNLELYPKTPPSGEPVVVEPRFAKPLQQDVVTEAPSPSANRSLPCLKLPSGLLGRNIDAANGRDDSDFYFNGQTTHSRGKAFAGTYDFKADLSTRQGLPGACGFFIDLKGGNDPNGSPDSLKIGMKWEFPIATWNGSPVLNQLRWSQAPSLESTEDFTTKNFIYASDLTLLLKNFPAARPGKRTPQIYFRPRLGVEVGSNLRSVLAAADGRSIARIKLGTGLMLYLPMSVLLHDITLETQYDRRWPLREEVNQDVNNNLFTAVNISTKPRDYIKQTLVLNATKFIGFTVAYEYGSLPPIFKLVDSKFTIGLNIKTAFK